VRDDVKRLYKDLLPLVRITLVEAGPSLLGPFDKAMQDYAQGLFKKRDIDVRLGTAVIGVEPCETEGFRFPAKRALLSDGSHLEFGTMVWSAGLAPRGFTESLDERIPRHPRNKRILVDDYLRVKGFEGSIWAVGDAAVNETGLPFPQLAQVARQQGIYMAKVLNGDGSSAGPLRDPNEPTQSKHPAITGFAAMIMWRFAYWGRQVSSVNKIMIPMHWFKTFFFGRDISNF
jgi:NADH dehydrogenase FAD-containing subunit